MGGCVVIILLPLLAGVMVALLAIAGVLGGMALGGLLMAAVLGIAYAQLTRRGVFERYADAPDWHRYLTSVGRPLLIAGIVLSTVCGIAGAALLVWGITSLGVTA